MRAHTLVGLVVAAAASLVSGRASAAHGESSFTPASLVTPIVYVELSRSTPGSPSDPAPSRPQSLYTCAAMEAYAAQQQGGGAGAPSGAPISAADVAAQCMVDLADDAALGALFAGEHEIEAATYDTIRVSTCVESGYEVKIKGTVLLGGVTYRTTAGADPLALGDAFAGDDADYVTVQHSGCSFSYSLPTPVRIAAGDAVTVSALFSLKDVAWGALGANGIFGGCAGTFGGHAVCTSYPTILPYVGSVAPTLETYHVSVDPDDLDGARASGQVLLLSDAAGLMIGGFTRRYLSELSPAHGLNFDTPLKAIGTNADGTYMIENYGSTADGPGYLRMPHFERATHAGTMEFPQDGKPSIPYRAVRQP